MLSVNLSTKELKCLFTFDRCWISLHGKYDIIEKKSLLLLKIVKWVSDMFGVLKDNIDYIY